MKFPHIFFENRKTVGAPTVFPVNQKLFVKYI